MTITQLRHYPLINASRSLSCDIKNYLGNYSSVSYLLNKNMNNYISKCNDCYFSHDHVNFNTGWILKFEARKRYKNSDDISMIQLDVTHLKIPSTKNVIWVLLITSQYCTQTL